MADTDDVAILPASSEEDNVSVRTIPDDPHPKSTGIHNANILIVILLW